MSKLLQDSANWTVEGLPDLLTQPQAHEIFFPDMAYSTFFRWIKRGSLPGVQPVYVGRKAFIPTRQLLRALGYNVDSLDQRDGR